MQSQIVVNKERIQVADEEAQAAIAQFIRYYFAKLAQMLDYMGNSEDEDSEDEDRRDGAKTAAWASWRVMGDETDPSEIDLFTGLVFKDVSFNAIVVSSPPLIYHRTLQTYYF